MGLIDFENVIGGKNGDNLWNELQASRQRPIEDWRFLAAFSIHNVGKGGCERLLKHHRLADIFTLNVADIVAIDGFAEKTATSLVKSLANIKPQFDALLGMGFNLVETPLASEKGVTNVIAGKTIVFTGTMLQGSRSDMEKHAKSLGATIGSSVSSKTNYLVTGENVGAAKTAAAAKHRVTTLCEDDYLLMIAYPS
jgi:DNA ligase (NAD+)